MSMTLTVSTLGLNRGDTIDIAGNSYKVVRVNNGHTLTVRGYGWWDRFIASEFFQVVWWGPLRAMKCADWMPESYYWEQECNKILEECKQA